MSPPTKPNGSLWAWLPIFLALASVIAWAAQTDSAQNVKIERLEIESASMWKLLPEMQEQLTRIITILEIREGTQ
ncbi:MAG: hypothetical protein IID41_18130 [Planctomycetes bacterium]|nr:hypothetical protein [Planctomycetota bacterium]